MRPAETKFGAPFGALDQLYTQILSDAPSQPQLLQILSLIHDELRLSVRRTEQILELKPGDLRLVLRGLRSLVEVPEDVDDHLICHHASFSDFLADPARSGNFYAGGSQLRTEVVGHMLKALSYNYDDPFLNRNDPVVLNFDADILRHITLVTQPSAEILALLNDLNPDFLFHPGFYQPSGGRGITMEVLEWLKNISPHPKSLIQLWEDYHFMFFCTYVWAAGAMEPKFKPTTRVSHNYSKIISNGHPQLVRILHAYRFAEDYADRTGMAEACLFNIHLLLNMSWDELRRTLSPLRAIIGEDKGGLGELLDFASNPTLSPELDPGSIFQDLAYGYVRVLKSILIHELPGKIR
ncbi:hypothetical protein B0H13DRAFT_2326304 [Mycena leptocephala]|nr:hypothetical protein B0H13DRAFT_2326304 [Mycena leptocephala]